MIYFDNLKFALQPSGGISVVWYELVKRMLENKELDCRFIDYPDGDKNQFRQLLDIAPEKIINKKGYYRNFQKYLPYVRLTEKEKFIFHSSHYRICTSSKAVNFTTVHDFTYEMFFRGMKENRAIFRELHSFVKGASVRNSERIICISENTKRDLLYYYPKIEENKVNVIYNGVSDDYKLLSDDEKGEYINDSFLKDSLLFVGSRDFYKNFEKAVIAISQTEFNLVIVGGGAITNQESMLLEKYLGVKRWKKYDYVSNAELNMLYNLVRGLIYPSVYEGFGIPILEAQRAGAPVVAFWGSSIPEVGGDAVSYFYNNNECNILESIKRLESDDFCNDLSQKGLINSRRFSWDKNYEEVLKLYKLYL